MQQRRSLCTKMLLVNGHLYIRGCIICLDELAQFFFFFWLFVSSIKTGTRRSTCLDKLSSFVCLEQCTTEDCSSRWITNHVPVFTPETDNQTNKGCLPKFVQMDGASSSRKIAKLRHLHC